MGNFEPGFIAWVILWTAIYMGPMTLLLWIPDRRDRNTFMFLWGLFASIPTAILAGVVVHYVGKLFH